jgi:hypothetical protein
MLARILPVGGPEVHQVADLCAQASEFAILADYRYREAERIEVFEPSGESSRRVREAANQKNDACLDLLSEPARFAIGEVQARFPGMPIEADPQLDIFHEELRDNLITTDLKAVDVRRMMEIEEQAFSTARESGVDGICTGLLRDVDHFIALRRRRPQQNDPVSVVTGGIFVGIGCLVLGICAAVSGGACRNGTVRGIGTAIIIFGIVVAVTGSVYAAAA